MGEMSRVRKNYSRSHEEVTDRRAFAKITEHKTGRNAGNIRGRRPKIIMKYMTILTTYTIVYMMMLVTKCMTKFIMESLMICMIFTMVGF